MMPLSWQAGAAAWYWSPRKPGSDLRRATVHKQLDAGDIGTVVGSEEHCGLTEIVGCPDPAERDQSDCLLLLLRRHQIGEAGCLDGGGAHYIYSDTTPLQVGDPATCEGAHRGL